LDSLRLHGLRRDAFAESANNVGRRCLGAEPTPPTVVFVLSQRCLVDLDWKAAALMESLGRNHALVDGNKRLAWTATWLLLGTNDHPPGEPLDAEQLLIDVVTGKLKLQEIASNLVKFAA
jgi:prophage maintenance system killer protein